MVKLTNDPIHIYRRSFDFSGALDWPQDRLDRLVATDESIRAISGMTFKSSNGGLAYSVEVRGDEDLFDHTVALLSEFETSK